MRGRTKSLVFVSVQLLALAYLLLTGPLVSPHPLWVWLEIGGLFLGAWAVVTLKLPYLRVFPEVASNGRLVTSGPYRFIRHPMYGGGLVLALGVALASSPAALAPVLALVPFLLVKARYEERLLAAADPSYVEYLARVRKRFFPGLL
ncbi:MAG: methyltransferase [Verrucomicrobiia bacterium]